MDNPLIRVMALHALAYCERLFYLEEVEEIRVADHRVLTACLAAIPSSPRCRYRHRWDECLACLYV